MKKSVFTASAAALAGISLLMVSALAADEAATPSIKNVMKAGFKGDDSLVKKATQGKISKEELVKLAEYCTALSKGKPEVGEETSWKDKTTALNKAVADLQSGAAGAAKAFETAANCKACHEPHRPKKK